MRMAIAALLYAAQFVYMPIVIAARRTADAIEAALTSIRYRP